MVRTTFEIELHFFFSVFILFFISFYSNCFFLFLVATCNNAQYGSGRPGDTSVVGCDQGQEGSKTAVCQSTGQWKRMSDTCILIIIKNLLIYSQVGKKTYQTTSCIKINTNHISCRIWVLSD